MIVSWQPLVPIKSKEYYELSELGFAPSYETPPCQHLGEYFQPWESLVNSITTSRTESEKFRASVVALQVLDVTSIISDVAKTRRAYCILSLIAHTYVWCTGDESPLSLLPKGVAIPFYAVSCHLNISPVLTHAAVDLWNFRIKQHQKHNSQDLHLDNITSLHTFTGHSSEEWFYLVPCAIENACGSIVDAIYSLMSLYEDVSISTLPPLPSLTSPVSPHTRPSSPNLPPNFSSPLPGLTLSPNFGTPTTMPSSLDASPIVRKTGAEIKKDLILQKGVESFLDFYLSSLQKASLILRRMYEVCTPEQFYHHQRPFLAGFGHTSAVPRGLIFEGVRDVFLSSDKQEKGPEEAHQQEAAEDWKHVFDSLPNEKEWIKYFYAPPTEEDFAKDSTAFSQGDQPAMGDMRIKVKGGSAGQSSLIHLFDVLLSVTHKHDGEGENEGEENVPFFEEMRRYMPRKHREFLEDCVPLAAFLRAVSEEDSHLAMKYNLCVKELSRFRSIHIGIVHHYIINMIGKKKEGERREEGEERREDGEETGESEETQEEGEEMGEEEQEVSTRADSRRDSGEMSQCPIQKYGGIDKVFPPIEMIKLADKSVITAGKKEEEISGEKKSLEAQGTGGTNLLPFLKSTRDETDQAAIIITSPTHKVSSPPTISSTLKANITSVFSKLYNITRH